jgi:peptide/nickel transport system ATP-binding protein
MRKCKLRCRGKYPFHLSKFYYNRNISQHHCVLVGIKNKPLRVQDHILEFDRLTLSTESGDMLVLDELSVSIPKVGVTAIVGESGAGKTMLFLATLGLLPDEIKHVSGGIYFQNRINLINAKNDKLNKIRGKDISLVFQEPLEALNPVLTCGKQIMEAFEIHQDIPRDEQRKRTLELLEELDLPERVFDAYPHEVSGGQLQRVMIAIALANRPELIIADEPTTALDILTQNKVISLFKKISNSYLCSIVVISHDLSLVQSLADYVIVMQRGRLVEYGPAAQIFSDPRHPYTRGLLICKPELNSFYKRLPTIPDLLAIPKEEIVHYIQSITENKVRETKSDMLSVEVINIYQLTLTYRRYFLGIFPLGQKFEALSGVTLKLNKGETLGIVGASGSGKTSLAHCLCGLKNPQSGSIKLNDKAYDEYSPIERKKMLQIVFQEPKSSLNPKMTIGQTLEEAICLHRKLSPEEIQHRALELLDHVGVHASHYNKYPHQFSAGQIQRVAIARALAVQPDILILDEAVSALDVSIQAQVLNLLKDLQDQYALSYIFISHDISVVAFMADRIAVMHDGQIVEENTTVEIINNPQHEITKSLIAAV